MRNYASVKRRPPAVVAKGVPIPPPTGGWDAISPLPNMPADRAVSLINWVPRTGWIEPRKGYIVKSTGLNGAQVLTVMPYNGLTSNYLFAAASTSIWDVTGSVAVPTIIQSLNTPELQYVQFANPAGEWLIAVNGQDPPSYFDGSNWSHPTITGTGVNQNTFINVNAHNGRLWFVQKNTTDPVYMQDVGAVDGTGVVFPLGQFMTLGGYLVAIGTWTVDTRQNVDEYIAFYTSRGEVLVYAGTDPSTAETWSLVGRYVIGRPIGYRCYSRISGDLILISIDGVVGMSEMLSTDRAAANRVSLTSTIMTAMSQATSLYGDNFGWQFFEYAKGTLAFVNIPVSGDSVFEQYVMNTITGAWCRFTGINAINWAVDAQDNIYFGGQDGTVYQWNQFYSDDGVAIDYRLQTAYNSFGNSPQRKRYTAIQTLMNSDGSFVPSVGISTDFADNEALSTPSSTITPGNPGGINPDNQWMGADGSGHYVSIIATMSVNLPANNITVQLNGWNMTAESGAFV